MSKEQLRYFFASFAISILLYLGMMGIFVADIHSRARGFGDDNALFIPDLISYAGGLDWQQVLPF